MFNSYIYIYIYIYILPIYIIVRTNKYTSSGYVNTIYVRCGIAYIYIHNIVTLK